MGEKGRMMNKELWLGIFGGLFDLLRLCRQLLQSTAHPQKFTRRFAFILLAFASPFELIELFFLFVSETKGEFGYGVLSSHCFPWLFMIHLSHYTLEGTE